jgi:RimJ/RimL family protein N-acetyltransferase
MLVPTFHTPRLILRELVEFDAAPYERYFVDYNFIITLVSLIRWPYPKGGVLEHLKSQILPNQGNNKWVWAVTLKEKPDELIGALISGAKAIRRTGDFG